MNDSVQVIGAVVLCFIAAFIVTGKTVPDFVDGIKTQQVAHNNQNQPKLLTLNNYIPPTWQGIENTQSVSETAFVQVETPEPTKLASSTSSTKITRSEFKNSASRDDTNNEIVIAAKKSNQQLASVTQARASFSNQETPYQALLLVVVLLMAVLFLARVVFYKKKKILYQNKYQDIHRTQRQGYPHIPPKYNQSRQNRYRY